MLVNSIETERDLVCAIIPAYNAESTLAQVIEDVRAQVPDIIVVDDGSDDDTAKVATEAGGVHVLRHEINRGKGDALKTGFACAAENGFRTAITLDADGQTDPAQIPRMLEAYNNERADVVVGSRLEQFEGIRWYRQLSNATSSFLVSKLAGCRIEDTQSGYRIIDVNVWQNIPPRASRYEAESEFLVDACRRGYKVMSVRISTPRVDGVSTTHFSNLRDTLRFVRLFVKIAFRRK